VFQQDSPETPAQRREVVVSALAVAAHKWCSSPIWPAAAGWPKPPAESAWFGDAAPHGATRSRFEVDSEGSGQDTNVSRDECVQRFFRSHRFWGRVKR